MDVPPNQVFRNSFYPPASLTPLRLLFTTMKRSNRKRTTLTPGVVDLPKPRRSTTEVALEKKKKDDVANVKAEAKRLAATQVAELEKQAVAARNEGSSINALTRKQPRKRPGASASKDVSHPIIDRISSSLTPHPRHRQLL